MAIKLTPSLRQGQQLTMTPQMQQAIRLLALNHLELRATLTAELAQNPMLEEMLEGESNEEVPTLQNDQGEISTDGEALAQYEEMAQLAEEFSQDEVGQSEKEEVKNYGLDNIQGELASLQDHLEWQIRMENWPEEELNLLLEIVGNINDDGYLVGDYSDLTKKFSVDKEKAASLRSYVMSLDPIGCGSTTLVECLLFQAQTMGVHGPLLEAMIRHHLVDIESKDYQKVATALNVDEATVKAQVELMILLLPYPGRLIGGKRTNYIIPDIVVSKNGDKFEVQLNEDGLPRLRLSKLYHEYLKHAKKGDEAQTFLAQKRKAAQFLLKALEQRHSTIFSVAETIVEKQQEFFTLGPTALKPMNLQDIADELELHKSTISRATTNKYMHTPRGIYELKYFFNSAVGDLTHEAIKLRIKDMVEHESNKHPLSDQDLVEQLKKEGIVIARRTVAKYRQILEIPSSSKRSIKGKKKGV